MRVVQNIGNDEIEVEGKTFHPGQVRTVADFVEHPDLADYTEEAPKKRTIIDKLTGKGRSAGAKKGK